MVVVMEEVVVEESMHLSVVVVGASGGELEIVREEALWCVRKQQDA